MNDVTDLRDTIIPKSDQLNADDLIAGPITVTVTGVSRGTAEQPVQVSLSGYRPFRPCKSMRRVLIAAWGDNGHAWVGRSMTLYCDPAVKFGGVAVGGIRISHLSDIPDRTSFMLTTTRAKRKAFTVEPLHVEPYPQADFEQNLPAWRKALDAGKLTLEQLVAKVNQRGRLTPEQLAKLRGEESWRQIMDDIKPGADFDAIERRIGKCAMPDETREELEAMLAAAKQ